MVFLFIPLFFSANAFAGEAGVPDSKIALPREAVSCKVLGNGLTILASERAPRDLCSIHVKIRSGSSLDGEYMASGISHLVEHMLFKGTGTRGPGAIEKELRSYGGSISASTSPDLVEVSVTVLAKYLPQALAILKDIFLNAAFDNTESEKEKEVIVKEIRLRNDEPSSRLYRILSETAYARHPYRFPSIGYEKNLRALTRADIVRYYNRMYVPNRIIIAITGGVDADKAISETETVFKDFRPSNYNPSWDILLPEPPQIAARETTEEAGIRLAYLAMAYHSTAISDRDLFAMDVLSMALGRGDNSRLNDSLLKNKRLVHSISCWNYTPRDPGLFVITAVSDPSRLKDAESAVLAEIGNIRADGISDEELRIARQMVLADYIFSRETMEGAAADLASNYALTADYDFSRKYVDGIKAVSKDDVRRVAEKYLLPEGLTIARLMPRGSPAQKPDKPVQPVSEETVKETLPNGLRIILREDRKSPTISVSAAMLGGLMAEEPSKNGISSLTARLMLKGTSKRKEDRIAGAIEELGGSISAFSGFNSFGFNIGLLNNDIDTALEILKDVLGDPAFPQDEIDKTRVVTIAMIKEEEDDIFQKGSDAVRKSLFPDSPYGLKYLGTEESVTNLSRNDILNFYRRYCVAGSTVISVSGDIDIKKLGQRMKVLFGDLKSGTAVPAKEGAKRSPNPAPESIAMNKEQSLVMIGFRTVNALDADRFVFAVIDSALSGFGRLYAELRDKKSLSYAQGCSEKSALTEGYFIFYAATTKEKTADIRNGLREIIKDVGSGGITDEEISLAKKSLRSSYLENLQTNSFFTSTSALDELYGLGYDNIYRYESEIEKVTRQDVKRAAEKYFDLKSCAEVTILSD